MFHHLWHEGSLSASGSKQNGLIMCKMGDHLHTTIIISISILRHIFFGKWESKNEYFALTLWEWHRLSVWIFQYQPTMRSCVGSETCQRLPAPQHGQICSQRQIDPRPRLVHEWMILYSTHSQTTASILKFSYFLGVALLAMLRDKAEHFFTRNLSCFWLVGHILIRPDPWS